MSQPNLPRFDTFLSVECPMKRPISPDPETTPESDLTEMTPVAHLTEMKPVVLPTSASENPEECSIIHVHNPGQETSVLSTSNCSAYAVDVFMPQPVTSDTVVGITQLGDTEAAAQMTCLLNTEATCSTSSLGNVTYLGSFSPTPRTNKKPRQEKMNMGHLDDILDEVARDTTPIKLEDDSDEFTSNSQILLLPNVESSEEDVKPETSRDIYDKDYTDMKLVCFCLVCRLSLLGKNELPFHEHGHVVNAMEILGEKCPVWLPPNHFLFLNQQGLICRHQQSTICQNLPGFLHHFIDTLSDEKPRLERYITRIKEMLPAFPNADPDWYAFRCMEVDCIFESKSVVNVALHFLHVHNPFRPFCCLMCGERCLIYGDMVMHILHNHFSSSILKDMKFWEETTTSRRLDLVAERMQPDYLIDGFTNLKYISENTIKRKCMLCIDYASTDPGRMVSHILNAHFESHKKNVFKATFACLLCCESFMEGKDLEMHIFTHHLNDVNFLDAVSLSNDLLALISGHSSQPKTIVPSIGITRSITDYNFWDLEEFTEHPHCSCSLCTFVTINLIYEKLQEESLEFRRAKQEEEEQEKVAAKNRAADSNDSDSMYASAVEPWVEESQIPVMVEDCIDTDSFPDLQLLKVNNEEGELPSDEGENASKKEDEKATGSAAMWDLFLDSLSAPFVEGKNVADTESGGGTTQPCGSSSKVDTIEKIAAAPNCVSIHKPGSSEDQPAPTLDKVTISTVSPPVNTNLQDFRSRSVVEVVATEVASPSSKDVKHVDISQESNRPKSMESTGLGLQCEAGPSNGVSIHSPEKTCVEDLLERIGNKIQHIERIHPKSRSTDPSQCIDSQLLPKQDDTFQEIQRKTAKQMVEQNNTSINESPKNPSPTKPTSPPLKSTVLQKLLHSAPKYSPLTLNGNKTKDALATGENQNQGDSVSAITTTALKEPSRAKLRSMSASSKSRAEPMNIFNRFAREIVENPDSGLVSEPSVEAQGSALPTRPPSPLPPSIARIPSKRTRFGVIKTEPGVSEVPSSSSSQEQRELDMISSSLYPDVIPASAIQVKLRPLPEMLSTYKFKIKKEPVEDDSEQHSSEPSTNGQLDPNSLASISSNDIETVVKNKVRNFVQGYLSEARQRKRTQNFQDDSEETVPKMKPKIEGKDSDGSESTVCDPQALMTVRRRMSTDSAKNGNPDIFNSRSMLIQLIATLTNGNLSTERLFGYNLATPKLTAVFKGESCTLCCDCGCELQTETDHKRLVSHICMGASLYTCGFCRSGFYSPSAIQTHLHNTHSFPKMSVPRDYMYKDPVTTLLNQIAAYSPLLQRTTASRSTCLQKNAPLTTIPMVVAFLQALDPTIKKVYCSRCGAPFMTLQSACQHVLQRDLDELSPEITTIEVLAIMVTAATLTIVPDIKLRLKPAVVLERLKQD